LRAQVDRMRVDIDRQLRSAPPDRTAEPSHSPSPTAPAAGCGGGSPDRRIEWLIRGAAFVGGFIGGRQSR
jgi:hypothetical protein